jgi:transcriptional regulator with XRE-family HTH domain
MDLHTARYIQNISQYDIQRETGVFQPVLSLFENSEIDSLKEADKLKIQKYLNMRIRWDVKERDPLNREELRDFRQFVKWIREDNGEAKTFKWLESFASTREAFMAAKNVIDNSRIMIPMPEMDFRKEK